MIQQVAVSCVERRFVFVRPALAVFGPHVLNELLTRRKSLHTVKAGSGWWCCSHTGKKMNFMPTFAVLKHPNGLAMVTDAKGNSLPLARTV